MLKHGGIDEKVVEHRAAGQEEAGSCRSLGHVDFFYNSGEYLEGLKL